VGVRLDQAVRRGAEWAASVSRTRLGRDDRPRLLTHIVTFRCNARCVMCDSWRKEGDGDMTLAQIESVYRQLPRLHAVRLTGGEPFVRVDFAEIAALAERWLDPVVLHVTSNGFLTDRIVRFCESRSRKVPLSLLVSIDGVGDKHNQVRGRRDAWEQAMATIRELGPRQSELGLRLAVNQTVVDAESARQYTALRELLRPFGVRNQVVVAYEASATYSLTRETTVEPKAPGAFTTFGQFERADLESLFAELERDIEQYAPPERAAKRYYLEGIRGRLLDGEAAPNPPCVALNAHLRLFPNGDVPTCQFNTHRVGNLTSQTFDELWRSETAAQQRRWVRACPGCWAECEVLPNAIYSGDLLLKVVRQARAMTRGRSVSVS
jgi:MoaA/NifB/PqqE/SkfB family radical SAM enzyme